MYPPILRRPRVLRRVTGDDRQHGLSKRVRKPSYFGGQISSYGTMSGSGRTRDYPKRTYVDDLLGPQKQGAEDLHAGVGLAFPDIDREKLPDALSAIRQGAGPAQDQLLFLALICGARFSIQKPEIEPVLGDLWTWLTGHPRNMPDSLAKLVIEALTPGLERAVRGCGGWRVGPRGPFERKPGHPPDARAAWTVAVLVEHWHRTSGVAATEAVRRALALAEVLLGRKRIEASEFYVVRDAMGKPDPGPLLSECLAQYKYWVVHDAIRSGDPEPPEGDQEAHAAWERRHSHFPWLLSAWGSYGFARMALGMMPSKLWIPFGSQPRRLPDVEGGTE